MIINRSLLPIILDKLKLSDKGVVIYGARQIGKTTLVETVINKLNLKTLTINADQSKYLDIFSSRSLQKISSLVAGYKLLFIDEAQRIPEIGLNLKIIIDNLPDLKLIVTGSSSLDLASKISEPLTGRTWTYKLYPISFLELNQESNQVELDSQLESRLIFGSYPEIFSLKGDRLKREYLQNLSDAYLYKDLLEIGGLKNSSKIRDLLKLVAFQVGSQVSLSELGSNLNISKDTVSRYLDYLEKSFIIFKLKGFSRNLRKEVYKMDKIYFYDTGVRNIMIDNLKPLKDRNDTGQLWENFLISEKIKLMAYTQNQASHYFWRTYTGAELDFIEETNGRLTGYEFKFNQKIAKAPQTWATVYSQAGFTAINRQNYLDFILKP